MLYDTLKTDQSYLKSTLLECLKEQNLVSSYKTIQRREKSGIDVYTNVLRDPVSGFRMYTGAQIRQIIEYEQKRKNTAKK